MVKYVNIEIYIQKWYNIIYNSNRITVSREQAITLAMDTLLMNEGADLGDKLKSNESNSMLKFLRFIIVSISWFIIVTNDTSSVDLFKSTIIFMFGLLYDYLCLNKASARRSFQRSLSGITLVIISIFTTISLLGIFGTLVENPTQPDMIQITQNAIIMKNIHFTKAQFCWALLIMCIVPFLEYANPLIRSLRVSNNKTKTNEI